ncbi:MAG: MerR family transcriptional regulator [Afipia sp.]|nr:MerR family transcriptional regulator [Afipia sp.]
MKNQMTIGTIARRTQCSAATIRYYEQIGLLGKIPRSENGRRTYGWPQISRLEMIRRCRTLGFSIEQVRELIDTAGSNAANCIKVRDLALDHLKTVRKRRADLEALERSLVAMTSTCTDACADSIVPDCTIISDVMQPAVSR